MSELIKVKRDGPRGWHLIDADKFDPAVHELFDAQPPAQAKAPKAKAPKAEQTGGAS
ncbi:MAG: hypothetical protein LAD29_00165 [Rhodoferax sp.]|nr:hypothetical protein [Rhodoferax sp.]